MAQGRREPPKPVAGKVEGFREGGRWINERPSPEEFAIWFRENVHLDQGLKVEDYIGGVVLIPAEEKVKYVKGADAQGEPVIAERKQMTYTPYPRVAARVGYFWDLMDQKDNWVGRIQPVVGERIEDDSAIGRINRTLPPGFFVVPVPVADAYTYFMCCSMTAQIYEKPVEWVEVERPLQQPDGTWFTYKERVPANWPIKEGRGTKQVPLLKRGYNNTMYADDTAILKAESGALGRALAAAGILTLGSGIASAEDMVEGFGVQTIASTPPADQLELPVVQTPQPIQSAVKPTPVEPAAPTTGAERAEGEREVLIQTARAALGLLNEEFPAGYEAFRVWATAKDPPIRDIGALEGAALRGVVKKVQALLKSEQEQAAAIAAQDAAEGPEAEDVEPGDVEPPNEPGEDL